VAVVILALLGGFVAGRPEAVAAASASDDLVGLWTAKRGFGPFARGPLIVERIGAKYAAEMVGRTMAVQVGPAGALAFELPGGQGSFRGRLEPEGGISGHWIPPDEVQGRNATPVTLRPDGKDRWSGVVEPYDVAFTFHLLVTRGPGDSLQALLRNPERDYGAWLGVDRLVREGDTVTLLGRRPGQAQRREAARGRYDPDTRTLTFHFPARGGSYDFRRDDDQDSEFYPRGRKPGRYAYRPPPPRDDGWPVGTLEDAGIDRPGVERLVQLLLDASIDSAHTPRIHALLVARHGKLVLEEYFHGEHRDKLHDTRSAAKSITAVLVGAAIRDGAPLDLATPVYALLEGGRLPPGLDERKRAMTLEHLLTMSAGFFCDDTNPEAPGAEDRMQEQSEQPDWVRYTLDVPQATAPGEKAVYCSAMSNLALAMVGQATGESPIAVFDRLVAGPMDIRRYGWPLDPTGRPYGGGSVKILPRDFLKFGQMMLDGGTWRGRRVLDRAFVEKATAPLYGLRGRQYGYQWWGLEYPYKDRKVRAFYAGGAGGQAVIAIPELDLVISTHGANYSSPGTFFVQTTLVPRDLLPAVREKGDDPLAPVVPRVDFATRPDPALSGAPIRPAP
jgi:CubicO group peptidase (beta-lactamase class C family)